MLKKKKLYRLNEQQISTLLFYKIHVLHHSLGILIHRAQMNTHDLNPSYNPVILLQGVGHLM